MIRRRHKRVAYNKQDLDLEFMKALMRVKKMGFISANQRRITLCILEIERLGWRVRYVPEGFKNNFWLRSTTYRKSILLGRTWNKRSELSKVTLLLHELVHVRQRLRLGHVRFLAMYAFAEGRWAIECSAYRANYIMGERDTDDRAERIYKSAKLGRLGRTKRRRKQLRDETRAALGSTALWLK